MGRNLVFGAAPGTSESAVVEYDDTVAAREFRNLLPPGKRVASGAMGENDGFACSSPWLSKYRSTPALLAYGIVDSKGFRRESNPAIHGASGHSPSRAVSMAVTLGEAWRMRLRHGAELLLVCLVLDARSSARPARRARRGGSRRWPRDLVS